MNISGKCFRLQDHFQKEPDVFGKLLLFVKQMPSPLAEVSGLQVRLFNLCKEFQVDTKFFLKNVLIYVSLTLFARTDRE